MAETIYVKILRGGVWFVGFLGMTCALVYFESVFAT